MKQERSSAVCKKKCALIFWRKAIMGTQMSNTPLTLGRRSPDPPAYAMTFTRYLREAIVIAVYPEMRAGHMGLVCADEQAHEARDALVEVARSVAPAHTDPHAYAQEKVEALFANNFTDDLWYSQVQGLPPLVLVKKSSFEGLMSLDEAVRFAHMTQVSDALSEGLTVPEDVVAEYRAMFDATQVQREMRP